MSISIVHAGGITLNLESETFLFPVNGTNGIMIRVEMAENDLENLRES
jgi:hypothetical protein